MATEYREQPNEPIGAAGDANKHIDPAAIDASGAAGADAEPRKRRGRPPGNGSGARRTSKKGEKVALDLSSITGMFVGVHVLLAERTGIEAIAITEEEGKQFMGAAQNVMRHYSVETTQKTLDWIAFAGTGAGIYFPRIAAVGFERRTRQEHAQSAAHARAAAQAGGAPLHIVPGQAPINEEG